MNNRGSYQELRFERRIPLIPRPLVPILTSVIVFTAVWLLLPKPALYWILMPVIGGLVWIAGFGWRLALVSLIAYLRRLEASE